MSENSELEDLEQLVSMAGWGRFAGMVDEQWGGNGHRYKDAIVAAARGDDANAISQLRQIIAAQREIQLVMGMVAHRIKTLKLHAAGAPALALSRRGGL